MNNIKKTLEFLGLSYKKELSKIILVNLIIILSLVTSYFFLNQLIAFIIIAVFALFINYFLISSYSSKKQKVLKDREDEFISIISYFKIFISNHNNVYHSFECIIPYSSEWMANEIQNLLNDMDLDKSVKPFITFANNFNSSTIENVMISIYQMIDEGESSDRLTQFTFIFEQFSKEHKKHLIDAKQKSLDSMNMFPLAGAGVITMILMFSILTIIGDLNNVI